MDLKRREGVEPSVLVSVLLKTTKNLHLLNALNAKKTLSISTRIWNHLKRENEMRSMKCYYANITKKINEICLQKIIELLFLLCNMQNLLDFIKSYLISRIFLIWCLSFDEIKLQNELLLNLESHTTMC